MKATRKLMTILLAVALTLTMTIPAFATSGINRNGTITINNAVGKQDYSIYRIFDLESYNKAEKAYLYKVNSAWSGFIGQSEISGADGYVEVDNATGLVTWKKKDISGNPIGVAEFAEKALAYAKDPAHSIAAVKTASSESSGVDGVTVTENAGDKSGSYTITFAGLSLGYYLIDSSLGALCALNTASPDATMTEKNGQPTVDKRVKEGADFVGAGSAQIGDTVTFQVTITAQAGAEKYVLHDRMSAGLAFKAITGVVKNPGSTGAETFAENTHYTLTEDSAGGSIGDGCSFDLAFNAEVCRNLAAGDEIVVTYTATLTKDAEIGGTNANTNETWLKYGDNPATESVHSKVDVYTYRFQLVKTDEGKDGTPGVYNVLTGAKFKLYDQETGGAAIEFIKGGVRNGNDVYRVAAAGEAGTVSEIEAGHPIIEGLDANTYWLEETEAPDGFNKLEGRTEVNLNTNNLLGAGTLAGSSADNNETYTPGKNPTGVQIENHAGGMLPTTGGIGTIIFYVLGAVLVIVAGAMLMRNRRVKEK